MVRNPRSTVWIVRQRLKIPHAEVLHHGHELACIHTAPQSVAIFMNEGGGGDTNSALWYRGSFFAFRSYFVCFGLESIFSLAFDVCYIVYDQLVEKCCLNLRRYTECLDGGSFEVSDLGSLQSLTNALRDLFSFLLSLESLNAATVVAVARGKRHHTALAKAAAAALKYKAKREVDTKNSSHTRLLLPFPKVPELREAHAVPAVPTSW